MAADRYINDPRMLGCMLARYKFVGKMLQGYGRVLEVGCNDGFGARVVRQHVGWLGAIDKDEAAIAGAVARDCGPWNVEFWVHDLMDGRVLGMDGAYCLDVLEHIAPADEPVFLANLRASAPVAIIGMPTLESQAHASPGSRAGHVNCQTVEQLWATMKNYWSKVFVVGMNDETLHVGFEPMTHYVFALGVG